MDDTDLCCSSLDDLATPTKVASDLQQALDIWEGTLHATGGAIGPAKTKWWAISFAWKKGEWSYESIENSPATLSVRDPKGVQTQLERLPASSAIRMLGVRLAPDGNNKAELAYLRSIAKQWAERIRNGHLPHHLAWQSLQSSILRTLQYPLPATTFSKQDAELIMQDLLPAALNALGLSSKFPRDVIHGPKRFQGIQIPHIYTAQGVAQISKVIRFTHDRTSLTGSMIRAEHEQLIVETGLNPPLFSQPYKPWAEALTPCWLGHIWAFCDDSGLKLEDDGKKFRLKRTNDHLITRVLLDKGLQGDNLKWVNKCRLWLQVVSILDLTQGHHAQVAESTLAGSQRCPWNPHIDWPYQQKPPKHAWDLWRKTLTESLQLRDKHLPLRLRLGSWTEVPTNWQWHFDPVTNRLYKKEDDHWFSYACLPGRPSRRARMRFQDRQPSLTPPTTIEPAAIFKSGARISLSSHAPLALTTNTSITSFPALLDSQPPSLAWAYEFCASWDNAPRIARALQEGLLRAVSDGSYKTRFGTASWVLETEDEITALTGSLIVPGHPGVQSSGRSELAGLYGIAVIVDLLCQHYDIKEGAIEVGCDGLNALRDCFKPGFTASCAKPHFDLICATRTIMERTPIKWLWRHVDAHQLDNPFIEYEDLDRWGQLNEDMDITAKSFLYVMDQERPIQYEIYGEPWKLWVGDEKILPAPPIGFSGPQTDHSVLHAGSYTINSERQHTGMWTGMQRNNSWKPLHLTGHAGFQNTPSEYVV